MDKETIIKREKENDGQSLFLYFDAMAGVYLAFGLSAYYTTMVTNPYMAYSEEMGMPVALLRREHILYLRQSLTKVEHTMNEFYQFKMRLSVGYEGYEKWKQKIVDRYYQATK